jgi:predicted MFS family arabinose efflux permease
LVESVDGPVAEPSLAADDDASGVGGAGAGWGVTIFAAAVVVGHVVAWPWVGRWRRR